MKPHPIHKIDRRQFVTAATALGLAPWMLSAPWLLSACAAGAGVEAPPKR